VKLRIPKWATISGWLVSVACLIVQYQGVAAVVPALASNHTVTLILGVAGAIVAAYGTPPHANTPTGGVSTTKE